MERWVWVFVVACAAFFCPARVLAQAQMSSADLRGAARDPVKAVIAGVLVTATHTATNISRSAVTGAGGDYRIPLLPPGEYDIKAEMNGFTTQVKRGVTLTVGRTATIDFDLQLGEVA